MFWDFFLKKCYMGLSLTLTGEKKIKERATGQQSNRGGRREKEQMWRTLCLCTEASFVK